MNETAAKEYTSSEILAMKTPEQLFAQEHIKSQYRALALKWHPDKNGNSHVSADVMSHVSKLYAQGLELIAAGKWHIPGKLLVTALDGTQYNIRYKYSAVFELGMMYVGDTIVAYHVTDPTKQYRTSFNEAISSFKFHNNDMKVEFMKYLPTVKKVIELEDSVVFCIQKTKDTLPLSVVLKQYDGFVPPEHVAWIMSGLHNMLCYLEYTGLSNNAIDLNNYFISPEFHSGMLLGGWWYSSRLGSKLKSVPTRTYKYMTPDAIKDAKASRSIDYELARATCRCLLGDEVGSRLSIDKRLSGKLINMVTWLRMSGKRDRVKDYRTWKKEVLIKTFGKIEFVPMVFDIDAAYKKAGGV